MMTPDDQPVTGATIIHVKREELVPSWLIAVDPRTPNAQMGDYVFGMDCDIIETDGRYIVIPSAHERDWTQPLVLRHASGLTLSAASKHVCIVQRATQLYAPGLPMPDGGERPGTMPLDAITAKIEPPLIVTAIQKAEAAARFNRIALEPGTVNYACQPEPPIHKQTPWMLELDWEWITPTACILIGMILGAIAWRVLT